MKFALLAITILGSTRILAQSDTLTAQVDPFPGPSGRVLKGPTHDLAVLDIRTLTIKDAIVLPGKPDSADELLIVKEGDLNLTINDSTISLDPGGVALIPASIAYSLEAQQATCYCFRFQSRRARQSTIPGTAAPAPAFTTPFILRWADMPVQHTTKGETRQVFSQATPWLSKIDLHATTLNPGEVSHLPHTHRSEEVILMRTGHIQEYINGIRYPATDGDLLFLPSGSSHAVENHSPNRCVYFALQWLP